MSLATYGLVLLSFIAGDLLWTWLRRSARRAYAQGPSAEFTYCPLCSYPLVKKMIAGRLRLSCQDCGFIHWDNPKPVTITLVPKDGGLVLVKRKVEPRAGMWALPGGFMEAGESAEEGAIREVKEETGLDVEIDRFVGSFCSTKKSLNQLLLIFLAKPTTGTPVANDDALEARVFKKDELPNEIAFPLHQKAIERFFVGTLPGTAVTVTTNSNAGEAIAP